MGFLNMFEHVGDTKSMTNGQKMAKVVGKSILLAGFLVALGSVEMSSRFSVMNFSKDSETLQRAADALSAFMVIGSVWALGSTFVLYASYKWIGFWCGLFSNSLILGWIYFSYSAAFAKASQKEGLEMPKMFQTLV